MAEKLLSFKITIQFRPGKILAKCTKKSWLIKISVSYLNSGFGRTIKIMDSMTRCINNNLMDPTVIPNAKIPYSLLLEI